MKERSRGVDLALLVGQSAPGVGESAHAKAELGKLALQYVAAHPLGLEVVSVGHVQGPTLSTDVLCPRERIPRSRA